jgi:ACS family tartrate transporter-like MFS transporter
LVGAPVAGWLLGVHWPGLAGWRWLFIVEGIPAVFLGVVTLFYLTDRPSQARWLAPEQRAWLSAELAAELQAKKKVRDFTILQAFCDTRVLLLIAAWFLALSGILGSIYWMPTFVKRLSGLPDRSVSLLLMLPALLGISAVLFNGWHSDKTLERRWHTAVPLLCAATMYLLAMLSYHQVPLAIAFLLLSLGSFYAFYPTFWAIPTLMLGESAAAATFGLINSLGQLGGFAGSNGVAFLNNRTHSLAASFAFLALAYLGAAALVVVLRVPNPLDAAELTTVPLTASREADGLIGRSG